MTAATDFEKTIVRSEAGGVPLLLLPVPGSGLVAAQVYVKRGSADEAPEEHGLASFTASMLRRGTAARSSERIAFELESLGAITSHGAGIDACSSSLRCAAADFSPALEILFDCLRNPAFDAGELEVERGAVLAHLKRIEDEKFEFTYRHYTNKIFAGHGYGHAPEGEAEDVLAITPERCRAWHAKTYRPGNMMFVAAGDFDPEALRAELDRRFADWPGGGTAAPRYAARCAPAPAGRTELRKPLEQGFIVAGFAAPELRHPDHAALRIACAALGEGFGGRLFTRLRDERSLAYAVGSSLRAHRLGGHMMLYIGTQPERLDEACEGLLAEAEALRKAPLDEADLLRARNYVAGRYAMDHQSLGSRAGHLARWEDIGPGAAYDAQYADDLRKITARDVQKAAHRWWVDPTIVLLRAEARD